MKGVTTNNKVSYTHDSYKLKNIDVVVIFVGFLHMFYFYYQA